MDRDRVGEIIARLDAITPWPWEIDGYESTHSRYEMNRWIAVKETGDVICDMDGLTRIDNAMYAKNDGLADAEFIAHAPEDIAWLLSEFDVFSYTLDCLADMLLVLGDSPTTGTIVAKKIAELMRERIRENGQ